MVEIDTLFQTKTAEKPLIPFGTAHTHIAYIRDYPPPPLPPGEERAAGFESRCLRKRDEKQKRQINNIWCKCFFITQELTKTINTY